MASPSWGFLGLSPLNMWLLGMLGKIHNVKKMSSHLVIPYNAVRVLSNAQKIPCSGGIGMEGHAFWDSNQSA